MSLPYLPLYVDDYEADTAHLTLIEDGAYTRLLRLVWRSPGCRVPADEAWLFRRLRAHTPAEQEAIRTVIGEYFEEKAGFIQSPRLTAEFKKADETSKRRSDAGKRGGRPKAIENTQKDAKPGLSPDKAGPKQPEPEPEPYIGGGGSAGVRETARETVLEAMGLDTSGIVGGGKFVGGQGDMAELGRWLALPGLTLPVIAQEIRSICASKPDGPPTSFKYFTKAMTRLAGALSAPALQPDANAPAAPTTFARPDPVAASMARLQSQGRI